MALSVDGSIVAAGAAYNDDGGDRAGHVRVFEGAIWLYFLFFLIKILFDNVSCIKFFVLGMQLYGDKLNYSCPRLKADDSLYHIARDAHTESPPWRRPTSGSPCYRYCSL